MKTHIRKHVSSLPGFKGCALGRLGATPGHFVVASHFRPRRRNDSVLTLTSSLPACCAFFKIDNPFTARTVLGTNLLSRIMFEVHKIPR